jgi:hypothetical protein
VNQLSRYRTFKRCKRNCRSFKGLVAGVAKAMTNIDFLGKNQLLNSGKNIKILT